jgi:hypothetical protein
MYSVLYFFFFELSLGLDLVLKLDTAFLFPPVD